MLSWRTIRTKVNGFRAGAFPPTDADEQESRTFWKPRRAPGPGLPGVETVSL